MSGTPIRIAALTAFLAALLAIPDPVRAQTPVSPCTQVTNGCVPVSATNPLPVTGGGGGGAVTVTAVTPPPATVAGTGKPLNTDLFGGLWVAPEFAGQLVDATHGLPVDVKASVLPTGAATAANQATEISSLATIATNTGAAIPAGTSLIGNVGTLYPAGSTPITASATGTTAATTATLAGTGGKTTYICGFAIRANATAAATANSTVTGTVTGTLNFTQWTAPNASGIGLTEEIFSPCVTASATNTAIAVVSAAPGTGGVVSVTAWGFQL